MKIFYTLLILIMNSCSNYSSYHKIRASSNKLLSKYTKSSSNNFQNQEHKQVSDPIIKDGDDLRIKIYCDSTTNVLYYNQKISTNDGDKKVNLILDTVSSDVILYNEGCFYTEGKT